MRRSSLIAVAVSLSAAAWVHAHSIHQSTAEAEYNPKTQKLEVSLTVFINDLELALIRHSERLLSIDKTPAAEFDTQIQAYLAKTFVVTEVTGKKVPIDWVGREIESVKTDDPAVTLFFEVPLVASLSGITIEHSMLCELFKDQTNLLHLRSGTHDIELQFTRSDDRRKLELSE
ncbi:MAG: DUF6702 family protein [Prosthecobacter sp.]